MQFKQTSKFSFSLSYQALIYSRFIYSGFDGRSFTQGSMAPLFTHKVTYKIGGNVVCDSGTCHVFSWKNLPPNRPAHDPHMTTHIIFSYQITGFHDPLSNFHSFRAISIDLAVMVLEVDRRGAARSESSEMM